MAHYARRHSYYAIRLYLVSGWCKSNFGASLHTVELEVTHITSCRNVRSMEHPGRAVFELRITTSTKTYLANNKSAILIMYPVCPHIVDVTQ